MRTQFRTIVYCPYYRLLSILYSISVLSAILFENKGSVQALNLIIGVHALNLIIGVHALNLIIGVHACTKSDNYSSVHALNLIIGVQFMD